MLSHTFCHIPRISPAKEQALWIRGIHTWDDYATHIGSHAHLDDSERHLRDLNPAFFAQTLKSDQYWRFFPHFRDNIAYVDIETTGLAREHADITTIALYDGRQIRTYVNGQNLGDFTSDIRNYKILVTYNGRCFDAPFIESYFGIALDHVHIDLRYPLRKLGLSGGLKSVERQLGLDRGDLASVDGFFAVRLWQEYKRRKNDRALETLLAYNCADVVNLEYLLTHVYNKCLEATPFSHKQVPRRPTEFSIPFKVDTSLVARMAI